MTIKHPLEPLTADEVKLAVSILRDTGKVSPTTRFISVSLRPSSCLIRIPMIEKIVQTAKHTVNARVEIQSARLSSVDNEKIAVSRARIDGSRLSAESKKAAGQALAPREQGSTA